MAFGFGNPVLPDLVEQSFVADLQNRCGLLAVPVGLFESLRDGLGFGFVFGGARQRLQAARIRPRAEESPFEFRPLPSVFGQSVR
jgi:hypothetical protein